MCCKCRMSEATTRVFPTSGPVAVMKIAVTIRRLAYHESAECRLIPAKTGIILLRRTELLVTDCRAAQVIGVSAFDLNRRDLADAQRSAAFHKNRTVDLRRVAFAAALGAAGAGAVYANLVDDDLLAAADSALQALCGNALLRLHEPVPALFLHLVGDGSAQVVGRGASDRLVA